MAQILSDHLVEALRTARQRKKLSQRALADLAGLPQSHISKIEQGKVDLRLSSLTALARVLGLELFLAPPHILPSLSALSLRTEPSDPASPTSTPSAPPRPLYALEEDDDDDDEEDRDRPKETR